ncbi:MAG: DEAD/DEAH box helicase [Tannerella sp.]|jgi:SNF2 family DNA or RNA helicase|nr:DEAD/DEAH box helicase [Tannerella sp.]
MTNKLVKEYQSLDEDSREIIHSLALSYYSMSMDEIISAAPPVARYKIKAVIDGCVKSQLLIGENSYNNMYTVNPYLTVWLFPLIKNNTYKLSEKQHLKKYYYPSYAQKRLLDYLDALCFFPKDLKNIERDFVSSGKRQVLCLQAALLQPAYGDVISQISNDIVAIFYEVVLGNTISELSPLSDIQFLENKFKDRTSAGLDCLRAEIAMMRGDFEQARELTSPYDESAACYAMAMSAFINGNKDEALNLFDKGLKKQRRKYKNTCIPVFPEAALFYFTACLTKEGEYHLPVFCKMAAEKNEVVNHGIYSFFRHLSGYFTGNVDRAQAVVKQLSFIRQWDKSGDILWRAIALGFTGKPVVPGDKSTCYPVDTNLIVRSAKKAFENEHYVAAYEAVYLLKKWCPSPEIQQLYEAVSAKLNYEPLLSNIVLPNEWEKQLNMYLSLQSVQTVMRKISRNSKTRVAYRFYPERPYAVPTLQSLKNNGAWDIGKNIAMKNFIDGKVDCMTEQDRRIAAIESHHSYALGSNAIFEMTGHPYVFLGDDNISVELVAAQPVLNVVKKPDGYVMECDVTNPHEGINIRKETNTRYKIYNITPFQYEIIKAVSKGTPVPEQGQDKLMMVLKHFSAFIQIHSDLTVDEDNAQIQQVDTDSRIRIQLLPMGDGLKAELFVKPFGSHPPYCKPGRGGKILISNRDGERIRVTRNLDDENTFNDRILNDIQAIENMQTSDDGLMVFDNPFDTLELLDILERHSDISVVEWPEGERFKIRKSITFGDLKLRVKSNISWFEVEGELKVDEGMVVTIKTLLDMMRRAHGRFIELSNGEFLSLSDELRRRLSDLATFSSSDSDRGVVINRFASAAMADVFDEMENLQVDKAWRDFRKRLKTVQKLDVAVPSLLQAELRPYQVTGFQWMIRLAEWGAGACLADDMGLGKTVQAIAVLLHRIQAGPALVVSPVSVIPNWISEVSRFAPSLNVKALHNADRAALLSSLEAGDLLITSYGLLLSEKDAIVAQHWATVILDEAHAIKNYNTKTSKAAMSLQADFRIVLTGTPLQNHLGEMWNLFQFINPGLLGSLSAFTDTFVRSDDENVRKRLKKLITPFLLRRTKTAVLEELPPKTEIIRKITLSDEEIAFYEMLRRRAIESLENDDSRQGAKQLRALAEITRLRLACCNPSLVVPDAHIESTKLSTFLEIAAELKDNKHRALVFSQFVTHLSIVRKALDENGFTYRYLDGSTPPAKREKEIHSFQSGQGDFFLISLKAGGLGLNLTAADYVIHLDPWWNPAIEDQASDRAHRIGQNRPVTVYRLVAEHTIEEKIIQLHNTKRNLADSLLEGSDRSAKLSMKELMELLKERY